jgi:hypothetical protein
MRKHNARSRHYKTFSRPTAALELWKPGTVIWAVQTVEEIMGFGRGALLWLIGIPLPIILLLALFMHH